MNRERCPEMTLRYWPFQHVVLLFNGLVSAIVTVIVLAAAIVQRNLLGYALVVVLALTVGVWLYLQHYLWTTQAWEIIVDAHGLSGKPLLGPRVDLRWEDLVEVTSTPEGIFQMSQIELRSQTGQWLRISFMFPHKEQLLTLVQTRSPHCRIAIKEPPIMRLKFHKSGDSH